MFPDMKRIIIEKKEEDMFELLMQNKGKVNFLLFNITVVNYGKGEMYVLSVRSFVHPLVHMFGLHIGRTEGF